MAVSQLLACNSYDLYCNSIKVTGNNLGKTTFQTNQSTAFAGGETFSVVYTAPQMSRFSCGAILLNFNGNVNLNVESGGITYTIFRQDYDVFQEPIGDPVDLSDGDGLNFFSGGSVDPHAISLSIIDCIESTAVKYVVYTFQAKGSASIFNTGEIKTVFTATELSN